MKSSKYSKFDAKGKSKPNKFNYYEEEHNISFREVKREKEQKRYRNYDNVLRSKNVQALIEYEDD